MVAKIPKPIGAWTALKLEYLDHYLQAYRTVTKTGPRAYYLDLFAGCGECVLKTSDWPIAGSPWRALKTVPPFTGYLFVEKARPLARHLHNQIAQVGITNADVRIGDCNGSVLDEALAKIPRYAPSFAFLDPSGLQLNWATVEKLARHRLGRRKMELLILYPYDMVIKRWLSQPKMSNALTAMHGDDAWQTAQAESIRLGEDENARRQRFVNLYKDKLSKLSYKYISNYGPLGYRRRHYYNVIFASDEPIGARIMDAVWKNPRPIPGQLEYTPVKRPTQAVA